MKYILICFLSYALTAYAQIAPADLGIIPAPASVALKKGYFTIDAKTQIVYADGKSKKTAIVLKDYLQKSYGLELSLSGAENKLARAIVFAHQATSASAIKRG